MARGVGFEPTTYSYLEYDALPTELTPEFVKILRKKFRKTLSSVFFGPRCGTCTRCRRIMSSLLLYSSCPRI
ncbi:hypothetical protein RsoM2USA_79 [Ralstonia phage RsoM2USA]|nr:hypothetical protein RsoM2USA_79 [Ralstonia phage RsoM2USA]